MYCQKCGHKNDPDAKFCSKCGNPIEAQKPGTIVQDQSSAREPGRSGTILTLGILSLVFLGPVFGIPAWVMANTDLRKIRSGIIDVSHKGMTQAGRVLGIIGTLLIPVIIIIGIAIAVGLSMFTAQSVGANRDAIIADLTGLAANAYQYRIRPDSMGGGDGSYAGYSIPFSLQSNENGTYVVVGRPSSRSITFKGTSAQYPDDSVEGTYGQNGKLVGAFKFSGPNFAGQ